MAELENRSNDDLYKLLSLTVNESVTEDDNLFDTKDELVNIIMEEITRLGTLRDSICQNQRS